MHAKHQQRVQVIDFIPISVNIICIELSIISSSYTIHRNLGWNHMKRTQKESSKNSSSSSVPKGPTVSEKCPQCQHPELLFTTVQLRSADEGQTVFFSCPNCQYTYSLNT